MIINSRVFQRVCYWGSVSWCFEVYLDGRMVGFAWNLKSRLEAEQHELNAIGYLKNEIKRKQLEQLEGKK